MQAEHIPVHLGSMPDAVAAVLDARAASPGDLWILNDPYRGGTHLPDITLISPAVRRRTSLLGFAASRAHHADIGGPTPGGMPADSTRARRGGRGDPADARPTTTTLRELAERMRNPRAAARRPARAAGRQPDRRAARRASWSSATAPTACAPAMARDPRLRRAPHPGRDRASCPTATTRPTTCSRAAGRRRATSSCGCARRSTATRSSSTSRARADQVDGNLNCPLSVTKSAAFFAVRVLTDPDAPAVGRRPPPGRGRGARRAALLNARPPAAVAAGNVETSSRVADLVIAALAGAHAGARPGPGDDEQPDPRRRGLDLLRDDRRRPGRLPGRRRARARSTSRCRTRSTPRSRRSRPSTRCACASSSLRRGIGRRRAPPRRRRDRARDRGAGADALHPDHRAPPPRRRAGRDGGADGEPGRNLLNGERAAARSAPASSSPGDRLRIETPGGGGLRARLAACQRMNAT